MKGHRPLRAAIVGVGVMGRWHAEAVARAGGTIDFVVDPDRRRAEALAARYAGAQAVTDFCDVAPNGSVDVAHLCTPVETHEVLTRQALHAGMHVLVEKPLTRTGAAAAKLLQLAEARGRLLCPVHQFLFQPGVIGAQRELHTIGRLLHVDFAACSAGADGRTDDERDRLAADILPHPLSLLGRALPKRLTTVDWQVQHPMAGEVRALGRAEEVSTSLLISVRGRPTMNVLRLIGEQGTIHVDLFHGFHVVESGTVSRARKIAHPFLLSAATLQAATANLASRAARHEVAYPGLRQLIQRFYQAVAREAEIPISPCEAIEVATARDTLMSLL